MSEYESEEQGYGGYYDERMGAYQPPAPMPMANRAASALLATTMTGLGRNLAGGRINGMGLIGSFSYQPDLSPVGSGENYYPGDTYQDALALAYLGYAFPNPNTDGPTGGEEFEGTGGSAAIDMAQLNGAWSPKLQAALKLFQTDHGMVPDGWIGPETRAAIATAIQVADGVLPPAKRPHDDPDLNDHHGDMPLPDDHGGAISPVSTMTDQKKYLMLGGGALALLALGWYLTK